MMTANQLEPPGVLSRLRPRESPLGDTPRSRGARGPSRRRRAAVDAALFLGPFIVVYAVFLLAPVGQAVYMSGFNWDLLSPVREFIGAQNYTRMFWEPASSGRSITRGRSGSPSPSSPR